MKLEKSWRFIILAGTRVSVSCYINWYIYIALKGAVSKGDPFLV